MSLDSNNSSSKIKRRNFFVYLGATIFGILSLSKLPFTLFKSRLNNGLKISQKPVIKANPYAVSRNNKGVKNG